jgi:hypothetical protein
MQLVPPCALLHTVLQVPQCDALLVRFVSHVAGSVSQSA